MKLFKIRSLADLLPEQNLAWDFPWPALVVLCAGAFPTFSLITTEIIAIIVAICIVIMVATIGIAYSTGYFPKRNHRHST